MKGECLAVKGRQISFSYDRKGKSKILHELDISVPRGIVYGLLGPSGCGKTTLLRCIVGRLKPSSGSIHVYDRIPGESGFCIPGYGVGYMPQELALYLDISIEETLTYFGRLFHMSHAQIAARTEFLIKLLKIPKKSSLIKNLSGGQKRRVSFAAALIHKPPLLILDEPTVGVDPLLRYSLWEHLKELAQSDHSTIIITTHYVEEARLASMVGLMREGHLLAEENPQTLIEAYHVCTLEEVFLKLCKEDLKSVENLASFKPLMLSLDKAFSEVDINMPDVQKAIEEKQENGFISGKTSTVHRSSSNVSCVCEVETFSKSDADLNMDIIYHTSSPWKQFMEGCERMVTLIIKNFIRTRRSWPALLFQLFFPALQILIFCLFIGRTPNDLQLAVVNLETTTYGYSQKFLDEIDNKTIKQLPFPNLSSGIDSVRTGKTWGVLYIGPHFSDAMMDRFLEGSNIDNETIEKSSIKLRVDMTNQQIFVTIYSSINEAFQRFATASLVATYQNPRLAEAPVFLGDPIYGERDTSFTDFMASGMMIGVSNFMAMGLTALSIVLEKKEGLLDRSWIAGVNCFEVVFSILLSMSVTMILQVVFVLVVVLGVFAIPVKGSLIAAFICVFFGGMLGMILGLLISAISCNENQAVMFVLGGFSPSFLLSGIMWPVEAMDPYLKYFSYCLPLTVLIETMRSILLRGWSIFENNVWGGLAVASSWCLVFILLSIIAFKYMN